jgi:3-oxoacyl-[acyl-carrier-protein] synthase-1
MKPAYPITAYSISNALGTNSEAVYRGLHAGMSGLGPCPYPLPFETAVGMLPEAPPPLPSVLSGYDSRQGRIVWQLLNALEKPLTQAIRRWGVDRIGIVLGTSSAGNDSTEQAYREYLQTGSPPPGFVYGRHIPHALIDVARARFGFTGPGWVISTACSSSAKVFGSAQRLITRGVCDAVIAGGVDTLCQLTLRGFKSLSLLSIRGCRPFAADRDGTSLGEGGALLLVEREGDGPARLVGVGETSDAYHMTSPHPEGLGAVAAMREALAQAGLTPDDVDYINAHATATMHNDAAESKAIASVFGDRVPVAGTKGYTGHTLGAAGALEAVFSVMAIEHGWIPKTVGAEPIDPAAHIQVTTARIEKKCRHVISNSFAFGGNNACVAFGAPA